jgi:predicted lipoprotein with Yx(FWY)xxD motif
LGIVTLLAACSNAGGGPTAAATQAAPTTAPTMAEATTAPASMAPAGDTLGVGNDPELGAYVTGEDGMALYIFKPDEGKDSSQCNGECAINWPPLSAELAAGAGITGELGTITRDDGSTQVTLGGWPLYYFIGDEAAGDVNGQGVNDVWYLAAPDGTAVGAGGGSGAEETQCAGRYCY